MNKRPNPGTIILPTLSACLLFQSELQGQISDGMWENAGPRNHWQFWSYLNVEFNPEECKVVRNGESGIYPSRFKYGFSSLYPIVGDRMIKIGQFGKALQSLGIKDFGRFYGSEYMPKTLEEFKTCKATNKWKYDFVAEYMNDITIEMAIAYYATTYTEKEMKRDIKLIKGAMASIDPNANKLEDGWFKQVLAKKI